MSSFFESVVAVFLLAIIGAGGFFLILIVQPWFWLAVIALILAMAFL